MIKNKKFVVENWIKRNGAASFDLKNRDIILHDGGLFSIEKKKIRRHKIVGYKKLPDGNTQILFSKNKPIKDFEYYAVIWFDELNGTINYLKRMKKMLKKIGYKTDYKIKN